MRVLAAAAAAASVVVLASSPWHVLLLYRGGGAVSPRSPRCLLCSGSGALLTKRLPAYSHAHSPAHPTSLMEVATQALCLLLLLQAPRVAQEPGRERLS